MARGNIGNLLQHFLALRAADRLLGAIGVPAQTVPSICYIDPFAMAPWEEITGKRSEGFDRMVRSFPALADDPVARTMLSAWTRRYSSHPDGLPAHPREREYPNTAVLLRERYPEVSWDMRLCEVDPRKRDELDEWARVQAPGVYQVGGDWHDASLLQPIDDSTPALVALDPYQFIADDAKNVGRFGYLSPAEVLLLLGDKLQILERPEAEASAPTAVVLLSFADAEADAVDRRVRSLFDPRGWTVDRVRVGPFQGRNGEGFHQGWLCETPALPRLEPGETQAAWDGWRQSLRDAKLASNRLLFPDLTCYVQARVDGAIRLGVEMRDVELFEFFENAPSLDQADPRLVWLVEVHCKGPGVPRSTRGAAIWFFEHANSFRDAIAQVVDDFDVGLDPDVYPSIREIPHFADRVDSKVVVSVSRRREGLKIASSLAHVIARWEYLVEMLYRDPSATV